MLLIKTAIGEFEVRAYENGGPLYNPQIKVSVVLPGGRVVSMVLDQEGEVKQV